MSLLSIGKVQFLPNITLGEILAIATPILLVVVTWLYRKWSAKKVVKLDFGEQTFDDATRLTKPHRFMKSMKFETQSGRSKYFLVRVSPRFDVSGEQMTIRLVEQFSTQVPSSDPKIENVEMVEGNCHYYSLSMKEPGVWRGLHQRPSHFDINDPFFLAVRILAKKSWKGLLKFEVMFKGSRQLIFLPFEVVVMDGNEKN